MSASAFVLVDASLPSGNHTISEYLRAANVERGELPDGFALFTGRHRRADGDVARVAFQRRGNLSLNRGAYEILGSPEAVVLGYNEAAREVAIKGVAKSLAYASPVRKQQAADSYLVGARAFTQSIKLDLEQVALVFDNVQVRDEGVLVIQLDEGRTLVTKRRKSGERV